MSSPAKAVKLVKARLKDSEYWPDAGWSCCEEMMKRAKINASRLKGVIVVDLSKSTVYPLRRCPYCQAKLPVIKAAIIAKGKWKGYATALSWLDLDETGIANGNYVEGPTA